MLKLTNEQVEAIKIEVEAATEVNDHNRAILILAQALKHAKVTKIIKGLIQIHDALEYMPSSLIELRSQVYTDLISYAKENLGSESFEKLKSAF